MGGWQVLHLPKGDMALKGFVQLIKKSLQPYVYSLTQEKHKCNNIEMWIIFYNWMALSRFNQIALINSAQCTVCDVYSYSQCGDADYCVDFKLFLKI